MTGEDFTAKRATCKNGIPWVPLKIRAETVVIRAKKKSLTKKP
jgi:hypothetical protein